MTQTESILADLRAGNRLTPLAALRLYGCMRLAARVLELKRAGHKIETRLVETDGGDHVAEYYMLPEDGQREMFA